MILFFQYRVTDIKYNSPAHTSGKIEDGDEIIQINYETVVGWHYKKVIHQLQESPPDIILTLKKRPKHTKIYGQIYMKPYRLPSKKKAQPYRWGGDTIPSPRMELLPIQNFSISLCQVPEKHNSSDSDSSDILTPTSPKVSDKDLRLYLPKTRAVLQRRNTICGDQVSGFKSNVMFWHESKRKENNDESPSLRDKSVSICVGLEITPRPTTCLGISKFNDFTGLKGSLPEITMKPNVEVKSIEQPNTSNQVQSQELSKPGVSKVVRFDSNQTSNEYKDTKYSCNVDNTILEVFEPIPYVDEEEIMVTEIPVPKQPAADTNEKSLSPHKSPIKTITTDSGLAQAVNEILVKNEIQKWERGEIRNPKVSISDDSDNDSGKCPLAK